MKVAHVIGFCGAGGAEIFVKQLLLELRSRGVDVSLWVLTAIRDIAPDDQGRMDFESAFVAELRGNGIPVEFVGKRPGKDWLATQRNLRALWRAHRSDVVHAHLESVSFHVARSLLFCDVVLIQTLHNTVLNHPFLFKCFLSKSFLRTVAISRKVRALATDSGVRPDRIVTIMNGVDIRQFDYPGRMPAAPVRMIVAVGRLTRQKNHKMLVEATALLRSSCNDAGHAMPLVVIVGAGELHDEIKAEISRNDLEGVVLLWGLRTDIREILHQSDIYVMSSDWEGLSVSLIEAMAAGLPVVATDAGSNGEIIEHDESGLVVPVSDPRALAGALYTMVTDGGVRQRLSEGARRRAAMFSVEQSSLGYFNLYNGLVSNSEGHHGAATP